MSRLTEEQLEEIHHNCYGDEHEFLLIERELILKGVNGGHPDPLAVSTDAHEKAWELEEQNREAKAKSEFSV